MRGLTAAALATMLLVGVPSAAAAQRYAAPGGSGTECTQAAPCELKEAVGGAKAGEEVIVTGGTYSLSSAIFVPPVTNLQIHGEAGAPPPRITAAFPGPVFFLTQTGDGLSYLEIESNANGGQGVSCFNGGRIERIAVRAVGSGATGAFLSTDCTIRNSLFRIEGSAASGLRGTGPSGNTAATIKNVTAIAVGSGSVGLNSEYSEVVPGSFTVQLVNSIVQGSETDLKLIEGANGPGIIVATHSNFDNSMPSGEARVIDGGGNQTAAPLFTNFETGDLTEAPGSPTIDAGVDGELGPLDLAGKPRLQGSAPDIGAFESTPPVPPTAPVPELRSIAFKPAAFRAAKSGGAVISRRGKKRKKRPPVGSTVIYKLSDPGTVTFGLERAVKGRRAGRKCVKATRANRKHKRCTIYKAIAGRFSVTGSASGNNRFRFSGRVGGRALRPGAYKLVGRTPTTLKRGQFRIVR
jgi:hypothetical protein